MLRRLYALCALLLLFSGSVFSQSQGPGWMSAISGGGGGFDDITSVTTDRAGNSIVFGRFISDTCRISGLQFVSRGAYDLFLIKYDPAGAVLWSKTFGGSGYENTGSLTTDASGNIYVTGTFGTDTADFGNGIRLVNPRGAVVFLARFDPQGNARWARQPDTLSFGVNPATVATFANHVFVAGNFTGRTLQFGNAQISNSDTSHNNPTADMFIAAFDSSGNPLWLRGGTGTGYETVSGLSIDGFGNMYLSGVFTSADFRFQNQLLHNSRPGRGDGYLCGMDLNGNLFWMQPIGGSNEDGVSGVATDDAGNVYATGNYSSTSVTFGLSTTLSNPDSSAHAFTAKYSRGGALRWVRTAAGSDYVFPAGICVDAAGNSFSTGIFAGDSIFFGGRGLRAYGNGSTNLYAVKYDSAGALGWAVQSDSTEGNVLPADIALDRNGTLLIGGGFDGRHSAFGNTVLRTRGDRDAFLARLGASTGLAVPATAAELLLYPNPVSNVLTIAGPDLSQSVVTIYDVSGNCVYRGLAAGDRLRINLSGKAAGWYLLRSEGKGGVVTKRFVLRN